MDRSGFEPETFRMQSGRDTPTPPAPLCGPLIVVRRSVIGRGTYVDDGKLKSSFLGTFKKVGYLHNIAVVAY
ncbi:hypothetical protein BBBOND_0101410 [Babesia bigemina]|uniref:Uncharacterized protein n=1 Tax=Babesia bigemina TaxID=5866 RepID=A0A061D142_BABBI|nr:hypothetical protein BBBOND_0101410 [Babesia bigemina]CDR93812.1 hypothetical protein BBBOND_0101410 [Babesia bigemina]|eukprot:XP_012765998.1 hypothetical protein BBBOND_0101410 [Babesia bigemina]